MIELASTSSSFQYQWTYDVFINFRGEDTRHGFVGNLYNALKNAGVRTFLDDEELRRGDEITPTLLKSIENSRMAITVFSKNYASSTFCLNELVKIHECIKREGRLVLPIFYDVEPSQVRHQTDHYGQALSEHMKNCRPDEDKIQRWKLALHEVANISGLHFIPGQGYEYQFIEKIVKEISSKINRVPLHVSEYPVGLEPRVKEITSLLQIGSGDKVIVVGICGMGGLGKTTIARALYNSIADNFEGLCFFHDVEEKSKKVGLERIQEMILSKIVGEDIKIVDVNEGVQVIKKRFKEKKILLILDNVESDEQLKKLAGGCDWFRVGSRIIVTTRDEQLLIAHGVESRYDMEVLNAEESLELLRWNAFRNGQVDPDYKDVLNHAVTYAQGLPLALEVIGPNLCGKTINEWESALDAYKLSPHKRIQQVLRLSYEVLEEVEKEIFLDIACFFNGENSEYVKYMVEAVHDSNNLSYAIGVLVDKRLIKIEKWCNCIKMHDLIRDMGRNIVREESPSNPGERSRLWFYRDIVDVLERNTGTNKIRMIVKDNWRKCIQVDWDGEAFKNMKELKILIFENVKFSEGPKYLPESLKVLKWSGCSSRLPPNFSPKKLVVLDIRYNCLSSLETIAKSSDNLGILNLQGCEYVKEIPDLSNLRNLKELSLMGCENLIEIHDSIGYLPKLEILDVDCCDRLKTFPRAIKLPSLRQLILRYCFRLKNFPEILEKVKIRELSLENTGIVKLPWSICNLSELRKIRIDENMSAVEIPNSIFLLPEIEEISVNCTISNISQLRTSWLEDDGPEIPISVFQSPDSTGKVISCNSKEGQEHAIWSKQCPNRVEFHLPRCNISDDILRTDLSRFVNVKVLNLSGNDFTILPAWMKECPFLETLVLNECKHLREVEGIPPSIRRLEARNCVSLSLESKSIILSEEFHGAAVRHNYSERCFFWVPSRSMPNWFDHRGKGDSISFWFRNSFPTLCLCFLLKPPTADIEIEFRFFLIRVVINEELVVYRRVLYSLGDQSYSLDDHHLIVCYIKNDHIREFERKRIHLEDQWCHAQVCIEPDESEFSFIEEIGMYLIKQLCKMEDVTFINPYQEDDDDEEEEYIFEFSSVDCSTEQVGTRMEEKEVAANKRRGLIGDDNFASSSTAFICTKRARNSPINHDDDDEFTPQVPYVKALEIINNNPGNRIEDDEWSSLRRYWKIPSYDESANHQELQKQKDVTSLMEFDLNTTSLPTLPWTEQACDAYRNQYDNGLFWHSYWKTPFYDEFANHQEFQQQENVTSTHVEQVPESFEETRKAKGKEIVIYDDTTPQLRNDMEICSRR